MALYKNNTGGVSKVGYTCKIDTKDSGAIVYANAGDTNILGIITQSVPRYVQCEIATSGITKVFCYDRIVEGSLIRAQKSTDRISRGTCKSARPTDTPYFQIGTALESGKGLIKCQLNLSGGVAAGGYVPYVGAYKDINIGSHILTGRFIARAVSPVAGSAPFVFREGTLLTVPEAGAMEFDGTGFYLTPTNHRRFISLSSDSLIVTATAITIAPTILWTGIINADELKVHRVYVIKGCGIMNNQNAAAIATITISLGATTIVTLDSPGANLTDEIWRFEVFFTIRAIGDIASGLISSYGTFRIETTHQRSLNESVAIDTTIVNDITISVVWSAENDSNWFKLTQVWLAEAD